MKYIKSFNQMNENNAQLNISGLKCDNCDYEDMSIPLEDYEKYIEKPCPKCGHSLLTQADYDQVMAMVQSVEIMNMFSPEELDIIAANLSEEEINKALDVMNQLKLKKTGEADDGREIWSSQK